MVKFIHASDLHLDSSFKGLKDVPPLIIKELREASFQSFQRMVDAAIINKVDFVILAGDLFDREDRNLRTQVRFRSELERLNQHHIAVYMIHGNHDHVGGSWVNLEFPNNVHLFPPQTECKKFISHDGTVVHLYGFSYATRHMTERMLPSYQKQVGADLHIGILHGNLEGNKEHSGFAPFTLKELAEKDFDYWALGHIHKRQIISEDPLAIYPGNIQGRHRKESGKKGCYLIEMDGVTTNYSFVETANIIWKTETIKIKREISFDELLAQCRQVVEHQSMDEKKYLLELLLDLTSHNYPTSITDEWLEAVKELLQEQEQASTFLYRIRLIQTSHSGWMDCFQTPFIAELMNVMDDFMDFDTALAPLFHHTGARRFLDVLDKQERNELLEESERYLIQLLQSK